MKKNLTQLLFKILLVSAIVVNVSAYQSMRRCMILPVRDSVGGAIGFEVFKKIETYLKASKWCYYKPNSEIINILSNYKNTLDQALDNPSVLKLVSGKTQAGSLIRVNLESMAKGMKISVKVFGGNGQDVYFNQVTEIGESDIGLIAQTVNNWLDVYEKNIPYDARVLGVLGQQLTVDMGKEAGIYNDYEIQIVRPIKKQRHPLLKEIVDWKTMNVAKAKIFHVGLTQSQAKIISYDRDTLVQQDDWVIITKTNANNTVMKMNYDKLGEDDDKYSFGKLGSVLLQMNLGTGSNAISGGNDLKKLGGLTAGIGFAGEIWATRNYWAGMDITKSFGSYSTKEGELDNDSNSLSFSEFKLKVGYKYLPLGFFNGPQIDGYIGYAKYSYGFDTQESDEITAVTFRGILFGVRGSMPLVKNVRMILALDFLVSPGFEEDVEIFGEEDSATSFNLEFGGSYKYSQNMFLEGGINYLNSKAKFASPERTLTLSNTTLNFGAKFNY